MRSLSFNIAYWALSVVYVLMAGVAALFPGRRPVRWVVRRYVRRMVQAMRWLAGIRLHVRGREHLPAGAFIIAAKHQSWGDGFCVYSQVDDVAFVTGNHLERFPLFTAILSKLGAIVVDNCGGHKARKALAESAAIAHREGRRILIYPEGHLAPVGERHRYRSGVFHMYRDFDLPVVPVATNLGLFWPQQQWTKRPGDAVLQFLEPIPTGLPRDVFMTRLEEAVESHTAALVAEATGQPATPSILTAPEAEKARSPQPA